MAVVEKQGPETANRRKLAPVLELHLSRDAFATGRRLSGVVVFWLDRPTSIRSLTVSVVGRETPSGASLTRALRDTSAFFEREVLLSGMDEPRLTSERVSQYWNAFLGRDRGRTLSAGEHIYPFSIPLPASLPPSYEGRAGRISYTVSARVRYPLLPGLKVSKDAPVVFIPRAQRSRPVAISYPNQNGAVHEGEVSVSLELPRRTVELGQTIRGKFAIHNPQGVEIGDATVSLEACEWVRLASDRELQRTQMDSQTITPVADVESDFEITVPHDAPPSVEGTAISVIWLLKLYLSTTPPVELKTPLTVFAPAPEE